MNPLSAAELVIYAILSIPVLYICVRHWPAGVLGWFYLCAFCTLRIVAGAMSINSNSGAASIISSVGLSPLILAACGILHEAREHRAIKLLPKPFEWIVVLMFHVFVSGGLAPVAIGASALATHSSDAASASRSLKLIRAGMGIMTASWVFLVIGAVISALPARGVEKNARRFREGTVLLYSVIFSLVFVGIRVIYSLVAFTTQEAYLSPVNGSLTIRVLLRFLPELIATLSFIFAGIQTRRLHQYSPVVSKV
ncbi:hypothetical protein VM1G_08770 [Cytospora mali]|uniref:DUF7702 domain-containing protein n=1 Tax=Cytospora mali TaxID=578113 RepID=A0A194W9Z7_CYTMA|nr:hypothetical protein VM1G_08770 [Valsa mali]